jgi:hypothetical protein
MVLPRGITLDNETELVKANLKELLAGFAKKQAGADGTSAELPEEVDEDADEIPEDVNVDDDLPDNEDEAAVSAEEPTEGEEQSEEAVEQIADEEEYALPAEEDEAPQYAEVYEDAESVYEDADQTSAAADDATDREDPTEAGDMPADEVADESVSDELALPENEPADDISVEENAGDEMPIISDSTMEKALERMIDKMISKEDENDDEQYLVLNVNGAPCIIKKKASSDKSRDFAYADSNEGAEASEGAVVIPYTREQYLALPRKKKKSVLMNVKKMIAYRNTRTLLELLESMHTDNPRILERMQRLEEKLAEESRFLPNTPLWEESVKRIKK